MFQKIAKVKKEILALYIMNSFDGLAGSLLGIFVPIYFLNHGYSVKEVIIYFFLYSFFVLCSFFLAALVMNRVGIRLLMLMRFPFLFFYIGLLTALPKIPQLPLWLIALFCALQTAFYYFANHVLFARSADYKKMEKEIGNLYFWPQIICIFLPLAGAFLITKSSFFTLIIASFVLYLLAAIPLWFIDDFKSKVNFSLKVFIQVWRKNRRYTLAEILKNVSEDVEGVIWPVFVFLFFKNLIDFGYISFIFSLGGAVFTWLLGKYAKKLKTQRILRFGLWLSALLWVIRFFFPGNLVYSLTALSLGFVGALVRIPFSSFIFKTAKDNEIDEFFVYREIAVFIGRLPVYALCLIFWRHLEYSFLLAAVSFVILSLFNLDKNLDKKRN